MKEKDYKTPKYTRDAIKNYRDKNKNIQFFVPLEMWEKMKALDISNSVIKELILKEIETRENAEKH